jgi:hypothetical protein
VCPSCKSDKFWLIHCYEKDSDGRYLRFKSQALAIADALLDSELRLNIGSSDSDEKDEDGDWHLSPSTALKLLKAEREMMSKYRHQGGADQWEALKAISREDLTVSGHSEDQERTFIHHKTDQAVEVAT